MVCMRRRGKPHFATGRTCRIVPCWRSNGTRKTARHSGTGWCLSAKAMMPMCWIPKKLLNSTAAGTSVVSNPNGLFPSAQNSLRQNLFLSTEGTAFTERERALVSGHKRFGSEGGGA